MGFLVTYYLLIESLQNIKKKDNESKQKQYKCILDYNVDHIYYSIRYSIFYP